MHYVDLQHFIVIRAWAMVEISLSFTSSSDKQTTEMENYVSHLGMGQKQVVERYADYPTSHDQHFYYAYEPPSHGHTPSKHYYSGGGEHKSKAAMSALTLLAFLFFLHILQQCIKDHMTSLSSSPIMIMSAGKEGNELGKSSIKLDKTVELDAETVQSDNISIDKEQHLTRVSTYQPTKNGHKYRDNTDFSKFVSAMDKK